jgi:hypothetical protein
VRFQSVDRIDKVIPASDLRSPASLSVDGGVSAVPGLKHAALRGDSECVQFFII